MKVYPITTNGELIYIVDDSRLKQLPFYKRLWSRFNSSYRNRYIDCKPLELEYETTKGLDRD